MKIYSLNLREGHMHAHTHYTGLDRLGQVG